MRFKKLDLLKFGRFDGAAIELPFAEADLHIVYGDNEAGKSTTLAALEYLLFGFPAQTGFNFKFKNSELRIGATLQSPAAELEFLRRKGHKDTLITADGQPLVDGEKRLAAILEGANQAFYRRHFLLDNRRLREGADELLGAAGDAGKTLLAAGAGIHGLMDVLAGYEARADSLWGKTNKGSREFAIAKGRLKEARDDLKAAEKNHSRYQALKREFESSQTKYHEAQAAVRVLQARQTRLSRIRRVHFDVQALNGAEQEIAGIGDVPLLPVEAAANFTAIEKGLQQNLSRRESYIEQRARLTSAAESSDIDNALLQRSADIDALVEARLVVMAGRGQLPGLLQKSLTLDDEIAGVARDLGWTPLEPALAAQQIVPAPVIDEARALALELATSSERQDAETRRLDEARRRLDEFKALDADGVSEKDSSALRAALAAANADSEVAGRREKAEEAFERAEQSLAGAFAGLTPGVSDPLALRAMAIPARSELDAHRDATVKLRQRVESARDNLHRARLGLAEYKQKQTQVELSLGAMSDAELVGLREQRDATLNLLLRRYVRGEKLADSDWQAAFGADATGEKFAIDLVKQADSAADARLANAEELANNNNLLERIAACQIEVEQLEQGLIDSQAAEEDLDAGWQLLWSDSGVVPGSVEQMLRWHEQRAIILQLLTALEDASVQVKRYRTQEGRLVATLVDAMIAFVDGGPLPPFDSLPAARAQATQILSDLDSAKAHQQSRAAARVQAQLEQEQAQVAHQKAIAEGQALSKRWQAALDGLHIATDITADKIEPYLRLVERYRSLADEVNLLRLQQIGTINRDTAAFETQAVALAAAIAPDLCDKPADSLTLELAQRNEAEQRKAERQALNQAELQEVQQFIDALEQDAQIHQEALAQLHDLARTTGAKELQRAIAQSEKIRGLTQFVSEVSMRLQANGDGKSIVELKVEVADTDLDEVSAEDQQIANELSGRENELNELRDRALAAKRHFDEIGSSGDAASAAGRVQSVYADMQTIAESFVRARTSERLLRWGIDHFRKRKQGPLLDKASTLFRTATGGAYERLVVEYDGDAPVLAGTDVAGVQKRVLAMSDGTRDQLYLALRLAAVEDYIERAEPMPFVADDIFVHFDDARTGYALKALGDLSTRCQVVVFTHHQRVLEIAEQVLSVKPNMVVL